jgi:hypothetical protein
MPLPTGSDLKQYMRIEHSAEDALLDDLVEQATAHAQSLINRPIVAEERTFSGVRALYDEYGRSVIYLPEFPVVLSPAPEMQDRDGQTVDSGDYTVDASGRFTAAVGSPFGSHPYSITAEVGLDADPEYGTKYEPLLRRLILGIASIFYHQRNPLASSDSSGGGVSVSYVMAAETEGVPAHLYSIVKKLRPVRIR